MKSNIGSSILADAKQAGIQAATAAKAGLSDVKIAFVYCSCAYDVSAVMAGVAEALPGVPALGNIATFKIFLDVNLSADFIHVG